MEFQDKFIAFIDILGFKSLIERAEKGEGKTVTEISEILAKLGSSDDLERIRRHGPSMCPHSPCLQKDIDFQLTQISDCVIISTEVSPLGIINLISHCWGAVFSLLNDGLMCRGYITRGSIYHTKFQIIGSGYQNAYQMESQVSAFKTEADERGTPFVEIDPEVVNYISSNADACIQKMMARMTESDGNVTALYPIARLGHSFMIAGPGIEFDPEKEIASNNNVRAHIYTLQNKLMSFVDESKPSAIKKTMYYMNALDEQLKRCEKTDEVINAFR
ncbi:hypothetical protein ACFL48_04285 [Pseudomonadota bacterium]